MEKSEKQKNIVRRTKEDIIEVASHLFSEYTYLGASMSDIAKKLNITKAALYYHFKSKAEIHKKVLDKIFTELKSSIEDALCEKTIDNKLYKLIKNYLDFGLEEKNLIRSLMLKISPRRSERNKHIANLREQIVSLIEPLVKEVISNKGNIKKIDSYLVTSLLTGMMDGLILEYSFLDKKINSEKISNHIIALLF
ncbi:MAG: TetR/AcrR family transcriptional regulator [Actinomycetia bacterium]|nr:TetR/AcrR family transcriptional regulator [Actinomycetes bacterium]